MKYKILLYAQWLLIAFVSMYCNRAPQAETEAESTVLAATELHPSNMVEYAEGRPQVPLKKKCTRTYEVTGKMILSHVSDVHPHSGGTPDYYVVDKDLYNYRDTVTVPDGATDTTILLLTPHPAPGEFLIGKWINYHIKELSTTCPPSPAESSVIKNTRQ